MVNAVSIYEEIEGAVLQLSQPERSQLTVRLLERLDKDEDIVISPEWREELRRRVCDIEAGRTKLIEQDEVWELVNERFGTSFNA